MVKKNLDIEMELTLEEPNVVREQININDLYPAIIRRMLHLNVTVKKYIPKYYVDCDELLLKEFKKDKKIYNQLHEVLS